MLLEQHYTVPELAKLWSLSPGAVRSLFAKEPDVIRLDRPEQRFKRGYTSCRIPESTAKRVYARLSSRSTA